MEVPRVPPISPAHGGQSAGVTGPQVGVGTCRSGPGPQRRRHCRAGHRGAADRHVGIAVVVDPAAVRGTANHDSLSRAALRPSQGSGAEARRAWRGTVVERILALVAEFLAFLYRSHLAAGRRPV
jgi:hypothetical protein